MFQPAMRNIEIKARLKDMRAAEAVAVRLAGPTPHAPPAHLHQRDTYFRVPDGRLKLRETEGGPSELIFYRRSESCHPRRCEYETAPVEDPGGIKRVLSSAFGVRAVVEKTRTVYLHRNVRIHLDRVVGLGEFLEFEAAMPDGSTDAEGESAVRELMREFSVGREELVGESYCELIARTR